MADDEVLFKLRAKNSGNRGLNYDFGQKKICLSHQLTNSHNPYGLTVGFGVDEETGFEKKRFDYTLTADGQEVLRDLERRKPVEYKKIKGCLEKLSQAGDEDYVSLSIAAKTYHILKESDTAIRPDEIVTEAKQFGWEISQGSIDKAVGFLSEMGMIQPQ